MAKKKTAKKVSQKRKSVRYLPDPGAIAIILTNETGQKLEGGLPCLIVEESYVGCGLVTMKNALIKKGATLEIQVGKLPKMQAEVRWVKTLENKIVHFGVSYLK